MCSWNWKPFSMTYVYWCQKSNTDVPNIGELPRSNQCCQNMPKQILHNIFHLLYLEFLSVKKIYCTNVILEIMFHLDVFILICSDQHWCQMLPSSLSTLQRFKIISLWVPETHRPGSLWVPKHWEWVPSLMSVFIGNLLRCFPGTQIVSSWWVPFEF